MSARNVADRSMPSSTIAALRPSSGRTRGPPGREFGGSAKVCTGRASKASTMSEVRSVDMVVSRLQHGHLILDASNKGLGASSAKTRK